MRAGLVDQAHAPLGIPESDQILAEQPDPPRLSVRGQIGRRQKRNPVETEEFAKRRALSHSHQPLIIFM